MPFEPYFFPCFKPFELLSRAYEKLHFHLLEFTHAEYKLPSYYFITECFPYLSDSERNAHAACFLYVQVVYEYPLSSFGTQIYLHCSIRSRSHFCGEHQIELTYIRPVFCSADRANDFIIEDDLAQLFEVVVIHCFSESTVQFFSFCYMLLYAGIGLSEQRFIKRFSEPFRRFFNLFFDLLVHFCQLVFDQDVCAITFFRVFVIYQWVVECIYVS